MTPKEQPKEPSEPTEPKSVARSLTPKQRKFAKAYLKSGNASQAVRESYDVTSELAARNIGSENLTKPNIKHYLELHNNDAENTTVELMEWGKKEAITSDSKDRAALAGIALQAAKDIQDRVKGKAVQRTEVSSKSVNININLAGTEQVTPDGDSNHA
jgi:phage terminase small subunit